MVGCAVTKAELQKLQEALVGRAKNGKEDYEWDDEAYDALDENGWLYDGERDKPIVGKILAEQASDYEYLEDTSYTMKQVQDLANIVKKELGKEPKLFMGARAC